MDIFTVEYDIVMKDRELKHRDSSIKNFNPTLLFNQFVKKIYKCTRNNSCSNIHCQYDYKTENKVFSLPVLIKLTLQMYFHCILWKTV